MKIITLFDSIHMMSMVYLVAMDVEITRTDCKCSLETDFIKLICMNP